MKNQLLVWIAIIISLIIIIKIFIIPGFIATPKDISISYANGNANKVRLWAENIFHQYSFSEIDTDEIIIKGKDFDIIDSPIIIDFSEDDKAKLGEKFHGYWVV